MSGLIDGDHWKGAEILQEIQNQVQIKSDLQLIESLKPEFYQKDGFFYYSYNGLVIGKGETPYKAMCNFTNEFYTKKA
jgi:hypothetical protein